MRIAIFGITFNPDFQPYIDEFFTRLQEHKAEVLIYEPFYKWMKKNSNCEAVFSQLFNSVESAPDDVDFLISIGGDGTFLESLRFLKDFKIPVIGLNSGRLGFLANISKEEIGEAVEAIFSGNFSLEERTMLQLKAKGHEFEQVNYALNDITIQKDDTVMISVDTYLGDEFLNTYWTDGLIVSTPTGSTAYSLSVGGPILTPGSGNFIIAPIASHNLSVRPVIFSDSKEIRLEVNTRSGKFLLTADNRSISLDTKNNTICISKAPFSLRMIKLPFNNFYSTIRNKLLWGADKRN